MEKGAKTIPVSDVDEYLASIPEEARATLEKLRKTIKTAAPDSTEAISYRMPVFKHRGLLVGFAAFRSHLGFYVMSPSVMEAHRDELAL